MSDVSIMSDATTLPFDALLRASKGLIAGYSLLWDLGSECLSGFRRILPIFRPIQMSKESLAKQPQWKIRKLFERSFGLYWSKCISQCIIIWCFLRGRIQNMLKDREKPELLIYSIKWIYILSWLFPISFCCQYIVIFLSVIPGSERMAIYIAPLHCHGECVSSSRKRDTPPQIKTHKQCIRQSCIEAAFSSCNRLDFKGQQNKKLYCWKLLKVDFVGFRRIGCTSNPIMALLRNWFGHSFPRYSKLPNSYSIETSEKNWAFLTNALLKMAHLRWGW